VTDWVITILAGTAIAIGIAGVILPILPGLWLIWGAALVYGLVVGFDAWGWAAMAIITALAGAGTGVVYYLPVRKTREAGLPQWGQLLIAGFAVVGFFVVPIVGAFLGLALGALLVALVVERDVGNALGVAWATLVEMLKGAAVQLGVALLMAVVWGLWAFSVLT
jgi:uncharacterized protein